MIKQTKKSLGTGVAGNVVTTITADDDHVISALYGQVVLTTDATVANRRVIFRIDDELGNTLFDSHAGAVVAASATSQHHEFMPGIYRETSFIGNALQIPIPKDCIISPGYSINLVIENGVAGDSYDYAVLSSVEKVAKGSVLVS